MSGMSQLLIVITGILVILVHSELYQLKSELRRLSVQLDSIREQLGVIAPVKVPPEVLGLVQAGRKIEAIKVYRAATGAGLAEAKAAVERLQDGAIVPASDAV